jgi:hypothetical protein
VPGAPHVPDIFPADYPPKNCSMAASQNIRGMFVACIIEQVLKSVSTFKTAKKLQHEEFLFLFIQWKYLQNVKFLTQAKWQTNFRKTALLFTQGKP